MTLSARLSTHGLRAVGATLCEVRREKIVIGRIRRLDGRKVWEYQPLGFDGWTGDFKRMRDAVTALGGAVEAVEAHPDAP